MTTSELSDFESASPDDLSLFATAGTTGLKHHGGYIDEEWRSRLKGTEAIRVYKEMGADPICHGFLWMFESFVRQTNFRIAPDPRFEATDERVAVAERIDERWHDMESTPDEVVAEFTPTSAQYGHCVVEETYKVRRGDSPYPFLNSKYDDGEVAWKDMEVRHPDTLHHWEIDKNGKVLGMWQQAEPDYKLRYVPFTRAMNFRPRKTKNNPQGMSLFFGAAESEYYARRIRSIEAIGIERDLAGMPHMQVPLAISSAKAGTSEANIRKNWELFVKRIRLDKYYGAVTPCELDTTGKPTGYKFGLLSSGGRRPIDVNEIVKRHESRILVSLMSELLLLGLDKIGSWAMHDGKKDMLQLSLTAILEGYADTCSMHAIPRMCRMLGIPPHLNPVMTFDTLETPDLAVMSGAIAGLAQAGLIVIDDGLERWIRETFGMPGKDPDSPLARALGGLGAAPPPMLDDTADEEPDAAAQSAVAAGASLAETALNGAQVEAARAIVGDVATGLTPRSAAIAMLTSFFPLSEQKAMNIINSIEIRPELAMKRKRNGKLTLAKRFGQWVRRAA